MKKIIIKKLLVSVVSTSLLISLFTCDSYIGKVIPNKNEVINRTTSLLKKQHFSGYALIEKNGKTLLTKGYGYADYEKKIPNTINTRFRIASLTKQFISMGIMMLQEKGSLSVEDKLSKYIPDYPNGDNITIQELLAQNSGIFDFAKLDEEAFGNKETYSLNDIISTFENQKSDYAPGQQFEYSNSNYILLGYIIEKVSGLNYGDYLKKNIFKPLNMNDTGVDNGNGNPNNIAVGYSREKSKDIDNPTAIKDALIYKTVGSAGSLYSTVDDLLKWDKALYTQSLVSQKTLKKIFTSYVDIPTAKGRGYGYGWYINKSNPGQVYHAGVLDGFISEFYRDSNDKSVIIFLSNNETKTSSIAEDIIKNL